MTARRILLLVGFGLAGLAAGVAAGLLVPAHYRTSAFLVVDGADRGGAAVASLKAELLSPALLEAVVEALAPYPPTSSSSPRGDADRLREDLEVRERGEGTLEVAYTHPDPGTARDVPNRLVALVVEGASRTASGDGDPPGAPDDADPELAELQRRIDETRARIERKGAASPSEASVTELREAQRELQVLDDDVRVAEGRVADLQGAVDARPPAPPPAAAGVASPVEELRAELAALRTRYTDAHPDVQRLLARLRKAEEQEVPVAPTPGPAADPEALQAAEAELAGLRAERARALAAVVSAQGGRARAARTDDETATLIGELRRLQERYVALRAERPRGSVDRAVATPGPASSVRLETPARWPREPSSPSRVLYASVGLLGGLALGAVVGSLADRYDDRIREPAEVEALLRAPQLADIPEIRVSRQERERHRRRRPSR